MGYRTVTNRLQLARQLPGPVRYQTVTNRLRCARTVLRRSSPLYGDSPKTASPVSRRWLCHHSAVAPFRHRPAGSGGCPTAQVVKETEREEENGEHRVGAALSAGTGRRAGAGAGSAPQGRPLGAGFTYQGRSEHGGEPVGETRPRSVSRIDRGARVPLATGEDLTEVDGPVNIRGTGKVLDPASTPSSSAIEGAGGPVGIRSVR